MSLDGRPALHYSPRSGWINDPLGLTYHEGRYHLFFQHVPDQASWSPDCRWGHATSPDGLTWTERSIALEPGDGDGGCWSGCLVVADSGPARIYYTSVDTADFTVGRVRVARAADAAWEGWCKGGFVADLPDGLEVTAFRDPWVFRDGQGWRMLLGAGLRDGTATALSYSSPDLDTWTYDGEFLRRSPSETSPIWTGEVWECPQFFPLGDKHVLTFSVWKPMQPFYEAYAVGTYADGAFVPESWGRLTYGPSYYAGSAFTDQDGSWGLVHWIRGVDDPGGAWASTTSLPHRLRLEGTRVVAEPIPAVAARRSGAPGGSGPLAPCADIEWLPGQGEQTLRITGEPGPAVTVAAGPGGVVVSTAAGDCWTIPEASGPVRIVVDGPVAELFTDAGVLAIPVPGLGHAARIDADGDVRVWDIDTGR